MIKNHWPILNKVHYILKWKTCYKDSIVSPSGLKKKQAQTFSRIIFSIIIKFAGLKKFFFSRISFGLSKPAAIEIYWCSITKRLRTIWEIPGKNIVKLNLGS